MNNAVCIYCNNIYVPKAIVALHLFVKYNKEYTMIIGKEFSNKMKRLCDMYNVKWYEVDLSKDFNYLDKRTYNTHYPIECFYHFYAYKIGKE